MTAVEFVVPIGNLNPPDHTLPTDHAYFYHRLFHPDAPAYDVVAPAAGIVRFVNHGNDDQVRIQVTATHTYYLGHVLLDGAIVQGMTVSAGQRLGTTSRLSFGLDLGLVNTAHLLAFVNPARYSDDTLHAESPFQYFAQPLRSAIYARERGAGGDGRIDFDQAGRLVGNWYLEGLSNAESGLFGSGAKHLAFVRDVDNPSAIRISMGGALGLTGAFATSDGVPDPSTVTPSSGRVGYPLFMSATVAGTAAGLLMVEMLDASRVRAEVFVGSQAPTADFTPNALTYLR